MCHRLCHLSCSESWGRAGAAGGGGGIPAAAPGLPLQPQELGSPRAASWEWGFLPPWDREGVSSHVWKGVRSLGWLEWLLFIDPEFALPMVQTETRRGGWRLLYLGRDSPALTEAHTAHGCSSALHRAGHHIPGPPLIPVPPRLSGPGGISAPLPGFTPAGPWKDLLGST